eukprot:jgi/Mesvir1/19033/Mv12797-RA.1
MALVIVCGQPCSGKSTIVSQLCTVLKNATPNRNVVVIDEPSLNLEKKTCYQDARTEKNTRGVIRSAVDRAVTRDTVVIVDSLNNIKGYRYELWCIARAAGAVYCMVHCDVPLDICRAWNAARRASGGDSYPDTVFEDLGNRFETPDGRNRWDSPLFSLHPMDEGGISEAQLQAIVSSLNPAARAGKKPVKLQPTIATQQIASSDTNHMYELDTTIQEIINMILKSQTATGGAARLDVTGGGGPLLTLPRPVTLPELRRIHRAFVKLLTSSLGPPASAEAARHMFADYVASSLTM